MSGMDRFYGAYSAMSTGQAMQPMGMDNTMGSIDENEMVGDSLDDIINQNQEMQRRRTMDVSFDMSPDFQSQGRRASMMEFGSADENALADFGFDPAPAQQPFHTSTNTPNVMQKASNLRKARSKEDLAMNTAYSTFGPMFDNVQSSTTYTAPVNVSSTMTLPASDFLPNGGDMPMAMDFTGPAATMGSMHFSMISQPPVYTQSPIHTNFPSVTFAPSNPSVGIQDGLSDEQTMLEKVAQMSIPGPMAAGTKVPSEPLSQTTSSAGQTPSAGAISMDTPQTMGIGTPQNALVDQRQGSGTPYGNMPDPSPRVKQETPITTQYHNAYSSSGFDMLGVLMRIANRGKPEINIGPVDLSCAFVVCDINQHDLPIVYCSEVFERLTGYNKHEILGRNCRFLQAPDGRVQAGVKRKYVDDKSVLHLKNKIAQRAEVQLSLINYRKGGQPFMNLLTMIPVVWDNDEYRYYVGFQVDLVEQPGAVSGRNPDGSYAINYQRGLSLPRYVAQAPEDRANQQPENGQTIGRDEVSTVLSTIGSGDSELSKRIWDKVLLENTDDVVHVLSLKGLFLYLSPACRKVLEYDASELVGTALSSVCHPSDIVPVTRELKDTSSTSPINVVFRIRRKHSGYTWFESHGTLHTEQGKGRKCIILVGRERPVYALTRPGIEIGDSEVWSKLSTSGMILFVASNVRLLLDRTPEDLIGTSMQALMRTDSRLEFGRALEQARGGRRTSFKHDLQNRRGQVLQAQTFLFPGDAEEGSKPTFLVAQTRLLKMTRVNLAQRTSVSASPMTDHASVGSVATVTSGFGGPPSRSNSMSLPVSARSSTSKGVVTIHGGEALTIGNQDEMLASEDNIFDELKTTRSTSWQFELRQMEKQNRILAEELQALISRKKKRKRRKGAGQLEKDCANCHTRVTPEWRRGPSGNRDLCNSCGLRWAKQNGRVSPRKSTSDGGKTPKTPSQTSFSSEQNKDRPLLSPVTGQSRSNTSTSNNTSTTQKVNPNPLPKDNQEIDAQSRPDPPKAPPSNSGAPNTTFPFTSSTPMPTATASASAPSLNSHIAKTAKLSGQNMLGSVSDRHSLSLKIDEDVEGELEDSSVTYDTA